MILRGERTFLAKRVFGEGFLNLPDNLKFSLSREKKKPEFRYVLNPVKLENLRNNIILIYKRALYRLSVARVLKRVEQIYYIIVCTLF